MCLGARGHGNNPKVIKSRWEHVRAVVAASGLPQALGSALGRGREYTVTTALWHLVFNVGAWPQWPWQLVPLYGSVPGEWPGGPLAHEASPLSILLKQVCTESLEGPRQEPSAPRWHEITCSRTQLFVQRPPGRRCRLACMGRAAALALPRWPKRIAMARIRYVLYRKLTIEASRAVDMYACNQYIFVFRNKSEAQIDDLVPM